MIKTYLVYLVIDGVFTNRIVKASSVEEAEAIAVIRDDSLI